MLGWIEKMVPQPPVSSPVPVVMEKGTPPAEKANGARPGLAKQVPGGRSSSPAEAEGSREEAQDPAPTTESAGRGVLTWLSQGLGKVIPQPSHSPARAVPLQAPAKSFEASIDVPDVTEVQSIEEDEEEPEASSMLGPEEEEHSDLHSSSDNNAPETIGGKKVFTWLMEGFGKMMPQPENMKKTEERTPEKQATGRANPKENNQETQRKRGSPASPPIAPGTKHRASADNQSGLSVSLFPRTLGGDGGSMFFERFVQGLEKVMPQPVTQTKQDGQSMEGADLGPGQARSKEA